MEKAKQKDGFAFAKMKTPIFHHLHTILYNSLQVSGSGTVKKVLVIGGDSRQFYLGEYLKAKGLDVVMYAVKKSEDGRGTVTHSGLEKKIAQADILALPIPVSQDGSLIKGINGVTMRDIAENVKNGQRLYGGLLPMVFQKACEKKGCRCFDYMKSDVIALRNAVATAEGVIAELIQAGSRNLHGSQVLVTGYGRCGRILCQKLSGMGAKVTVMARREEVRAEAEAFGYEVLSMLEDGAESSLSHFNFVVNTIPVMTLSWEILAGFKKDVYILDIASAPGGTDFAACEELGLRATLSLGLPGKYSPQTSGEILGKQIVSHCKNRS